MAEIKSPVWAIIHISIFCSLLPFPKKKKEYESLENMPVAMVLENC